MPRRARMRWIVFTVLVTTGLILAACGTQATEPRPTFEPTETFDFSQRVQPTDRPAADTTDATPATEVAAAPTDTPPPTDTPLPEPTATPTAAPVTPTEAAPSATPTPAETGDDQSDQGLPGDPELGEELFRFLPNPDTDQRCLTCHNPDEPLPGVGPYVYGIANVAGQRIEGQSAEEYLRSAILNPDDHIAPPQEGGPEQWPEGVMPDNWGDVLTPEEIDALVAYLLTLDQEGTE